jgi:hypothetical protein
VQNPEDVDRTLAGKTIEHEMSTTALVPCDVERAQARLNLVACVAVGNKRIGGQCAERVDERLAIDRCLLSPELLGRPVKDGHKVVLGWLGQANAPASPPLRHFLAPRSPRFDNPFRFLAQVGLQTFWLSKLGVRAGLDCGDSSRRRGAQRLQLRRVLSLAPFDEAQALPNNLTSILVSPGLHQRLNELLLVVSQDHVASRHVQILAVLADYANGPRCIAGSQDACVIASNRQRSGVGNSGVALTDNATVDVEMARR